MLSDNLLSLTTVSKLLVLLYSLVAADMIQILLILWSLQYLSFLKILLGISAVQVDFQCLLWI